MNVRQVGKCVWSVTEYCTFHSEKSGNEHNAPQLTVLDKDKQIT